VSDHLRRELDFIEEAKNAEKTAGFIKAEPRLADKVYIPKVYPEYSSKKVMTAEWIDGIRLSDRPAIHALMGESESDSSNSSSPAFPTSLFPTSLSSTQYTTSKPLKGGLKAIMQPMVELFSAQMFNWGWVHCDPHPGNVIIRENPLRPGHPQLVLIDHGLYVSVDEGFKWQWVALWRGMLARDFGKVENVTKAWGMGAPELLASATLMKPVRLKDERKEQKRDKDRENNEKEGEKELSQYEMSVLMKKRLKEFLSDTDKMPKVLIFLMRNMRLVFFGTSPDAAHS
jgi:aarF domain-containing kinase